MSWAVAPTPTLFCPLSSGTPPSASIHAPNDVLLSMSTLAAQWFAVAVTVVSDVSMPTCARYDVMVALNDGFRKTVPLSDSPLNVASDERGEWTPQENRSYRPEQ